MGWHVKMPLIFFGRVNDGVIAVSSWRDISGFREGKHKRCLSVACFPSFAELSLLTTEKVGPDIGPFFFRSALLHTQKKVGRWEGEQSQFPQAQPCKLLQRGACLLDGGKVLLSPFLFGTS